MTTSYAFAPRPIAMHRTTLPRPRVGPSMPAHAAGSEHAIAVLQEFGARQDAVFGTREAEALTMLYQEHAGTLLQIARRLTQNLEDAQDVVQEVFVDLPRALRQYRPGNFTGWLRCVTARAALMSVRRRSRRREDSDSTLAESPWAVTEPDDFDALEDLATLRRGINALPDSFREIIALRVYADMSHQEIARLLGISVNASEVRLCRAVKHLRTLLSDMRSDVRLGRTGS